MRIRSGLHLPLSGGLGFDLTDRHDCHAWLLDTGAGWALFDAGAGRDTAAALAAIAASGVDPQTVRWLLMTHAHADHSGGAAGLRAAVGLRVLAGERTAQLMESGDAAGIGLERAKQAGIYPADYVYRACAVDQRLAPGETVTLGGLAIETIPSPGHSRDHLCYRVTRDGVALLLAGDALFWGGRMVWQDLPDCDVPASCATARRLAALAFDAFLPGHGAFSLRNGRRHAERAVERVRGLLAPLPVD